MDDHTSPPPSGSLESAEMRIRIESNDALNRYWRKNVMIMSGMLFLWAFFSLGCGVLWADWLNQYRLFGSGYPLGFWFAQQGSIIAFVLIVLSYVFLMNRLDRNHREELGRIRAKEGGEA